MFSSLMCVVGLATCCGLCCLKEQPLIKNAISESVGNSQVSSYITYGEFAIDDDTDFNFGACNFDSPTGVSFFDNYLSYVNAYFGGFDLIASYDSNTFYDIFPFSNYDSLTLNSACYLVSSYVVQGGTSYLSFAMGINTSYASSLSSDGVNAYFDLYASNDEFDIPISHSSFNASVYYVDNQLFGNTVLLTDPISSRYLCFSDNDITGASVDTSPFYYDNQYEFWNSEQQTYVIGSRLGFNFSFVNTNTNGFETFNHPFYWNHYVYTLSWDSTEMGFDFSPLGDHVFCSFTMKGLEVGSSSAYQLGYSDGFNSGYQSGVLAGNDSAYQNGYQAGYQSGSTANFSWNGLFGAVADTPITMLRGMFNFDLFGMNVLSVVLTLLVSIIVVRIIIKVIL